MRAHSSSVRSVGLRLVFFSMAAILARFARAHIPSLNQADNEPSTILKRSLRGCLETQAGP